MQAMGLRGFQTQESRQKKVQMSGMMIQNDDVGIISSLQDPQTPHEACALDGSRTMDGGGGEGGV